MVIKMSIKKLSRKPPNPPKPSNPRKIIKKQKGGDTGTDGSLSTLSDNIAALSDSIISAIVDTTELVISVVELPYDAGKAYTEPSAQSLSV